ncbi:MAG: hypothetical protein QMD46_04150 [Methanomicrobiales archaeon]|nr:hypothetical protein [Methanomicrobiales archaeon]
MARPSGRPYPERPPLHRQRQETLLSRLLLLAVTVVVLAFLCASAAAAPQDPPPQDPVTAVYFTGVGCSHCARVDPVLFQDWMQAYPELVVVEYEIFRQRENGAVLLQFDERYGTGTGVPLLFFSGGLSYAGDSAILAQTPGTMAKLRENRSLLAEDGIDIASADIAALPGYPKIWHRERVLIKKGSGGETAILRTLLLSGNVTASLSGIPYRVVPPEPVPLSGREAAFQHAVELEGWILQWNASVGPGPSDEGQVGNESSANCTALPQISLPTVIGLAIVDAINPCALAVLILMLLAVTTHNPGGKRDVLLAGTAFTAAVFVCYFMYGIALTLFFQALQGLAPVRLLLYQVLGVGAILLGSLHLLDFFGRSGGRRITALPGSSRARIGRILSRMISPRGAFLVGAFVSVFLLPCTIGPYILGCGILSILGLVQVIPYLLLYNLIFILPMAGITLAMYVGIGTAADAAGWREQNVRYLHLISGTIILLIGTAMLIGLI